MRFLIPALLMFCLSACGMVGFPGVYRIDVEQGNIVTQEQLEQLKPGMSQRQVRFLLGTPLVEDTFNPGRWDYSYSKRNGLDILAESKLTVIFDGDNLVDVKGEAAPAAFRDSVPEASDGDAASFPEDDTI